MNINCKIPDGFTKNADKSTGTMSVYYSGIATIILGYQATTDDTSTPDSFLKSILASLPKEKDVEFKLVSSAAANFGSYPEYIIKWTTGSNEDTYAYEAHFILTDGFIYRIEYGVSSDSAADESSRMDAFFKSAALAD